MSRLDEERAILVLEDGTLFEGISIGASVLSAGEVVFNTSLTGYQEILTDPSYRKQLVTLTYPHIGNVGINEEDVESSGVFMSGLIIKNLPLRNSNYRSSTTLQDFLVAAGVPAIAGIDTRKLTRILREEGAKNACLMTGDCDSVVAQGHARNFPGLKGMDLVKEVGCSSPYKWTESEWQWNVGFTDAPEPKFHVVAYDFGVKRNILRKLVSRKCRVTVVPPVTSADEVMAMNPDGIFLSNGPGDPEPCKYAVEEIKRFVSSKIPIFGICLGHQLLALANGATTLKMKFGHHGANHPVKDLETGRVLITSQNHGFCVDKDSLPSNLRISHISLFDGTIQGIEMIDHPVFSFQGHPEASPGPHDIDCLFDKFIGKM